MKHGVIAPWADPVPDTPYPLTAADLLVLPDDEWQYELVEGRLVRMPGSGSKASRIAQYLAYVLMQFVLPRHLGDVSGPDGEYNLTQPGDPQETALIPDVAFVQAGRLPFVDSTEADAIPQIAPDLVVEIASPSQSHPELDAKARLYLACGVRLVWIVWPKQQRMDVWHPGSAQPAAHLGANDVLDGGDVLPGFTHAVADLFARH